MRLQRTTIKKFQNTVLSFYTTNKRSFPWRAQVTPYRVMVSEIMLQQTQTDRVVEKFKSFIKEFPNITALSEASLAAVLKAWQGLGYNRRGKNLHAAARYIKKYHNGKVPKSIEALLLVPGIGPYTAGAILAFAFDKPVIFVETNIRSVFIHHFFSDRDDVDDKEIMSLVKQTLPQSSAREWYSALMDYGSYLKKLHPNPSRRSKHHTQQSKFEGSNRQARGLILKSLANTDSLTHQQLSQQVDHVSFENALQQLLAEGLIILKRKKYSIAE